MSYGSVPGISKTIPESKAHLIESMRSFLKRQWKNISLAIAILVATVSMYNYSITSTKAATLEKMITTSTQRVKDLTSEVIQLRIQYRPTDFASVDDLKLFVVMADAGTTKAGTWERVLRLQDEALKRGKLLQYQLVTNAMQGEVEFWAMAKIGNELYCIEPGNVIGKYYPMDWWKGAEKAPEWKLPEMPKITKK